MKMLCESTLSSTPCCTALLWHYVSYCDIITKLSYSYNPNLWLCPSLCHCLEIFFVCCVVFWSRSGLQQELQTAARWVWVGGREREAVSAIDWVARNQFCNSSRKLRGLGGGLLASSDLRSRHQTAQYRQYNSTTPGHWDRSQGIS